VTSGISKLPISSNMVRAFETCSHGKGSGARLLKEVFASDSILLPTIRALPSAPSKGFSDRLHLTTSATAAAAVFSLISGHTCEHHGDAAAYMCSTHSPSLLTLLPHTLAATGHICDIAARADGGGVGLRREERGRRRGCADAASTKLWKNMVKTDISSTVKHFLVLDIDPVDY
jgi:hypothetical protein